MNAICWTEFKVSDIGDTVEQRGVVGQGRLYGVFRE